MLKIKEHKLQEYKNYIDEVFHDNSVTFKVIYLPEDNPDKNSFLTYGVGTNIGIVCHVKDKNKLGCSVINNGKVNYLEKEGFSQEFIEEAPIWIEKPNLDEFITFMAHPKSIIFKND
jgi:hypothetical protein